MRFDMGRHRGGARGSDGLDFPDLGEQVPCGRHRSGRGGHFGHLFGHGNLHFAVLYLIAEKPRHGYEIIKTIEEMVGGTYSPSPGTVYPALSMLEDQGFVTVEIVEGTKKLYTVTEDGKTYLTQHKTTVEALLTGLKMAGRQRSEEEPPAPIIRAVGNLKLALHLKLAQSPLNEECIQSIASILDRAAKDIEQS